MSKCDEAEEMINNTLKLSQYKLEGLGHTEEVTFSLIIFKYWTTSYSYV